MAVSFIETIIGASTLDKEARAKLAELPMAAFAFSFAFLNGGSPFVTFSIGTSLIKVLSLDLIRSSLVPLVMVNLAEYDVFPGQDSVQKYISSAKKTATERPEILYAAAASGPKDAITSLLAARANPDEALRLAAVKGSTKVIKNLLDQKCSPDGTDIQARTIMHSAVMRGQTEIVKLLVEMRANPEAKDEMHNNAVDMAVREGNINLMSCFAHNKGRDNKTCLILSAEQGKTALVAELISARADLEAKATPPQILIMTRAGDTGSVGRALFTDQQNNNNDSMTALIWAAVHGHTECVIELVKARADLEAKRPQNGKTALMMLLEQTNDATGKTALLMLPECAIELVKARADLDAAAAKRRPGRR